MSKFDPKSTINARPVGVDNYGTLPEGIKTTEIKNRKEGM